MTTTSLSGPHAAPYHIQLMYGNGGGGHKASAHAIRHVLQTGPAADYVYVELVDASAIAGAAPGDWLYNLLLSYDAVPVIELMHTALHNVVLPVVLPSLRQAFRAHFGKAPNLSCVISFVPILNAVFADALPAALPLLTVFTDFSHTHGHPWIQHPRQHLVAGTAVAVAQALSHAYQLVGTASPSMRVSPTSGMVVHPRFYARLSHAARRRKRVDMGFTPDLPIVLLLFGAIPPTDRVARLVDLFLSRPPPSAVNVICVCAKNRALHDRLVRRKQRHKERRLVVTAFSNDIPLFMQVSDVLVGKPGPGVVSEAFVSALPSVLVTGSSENNVMKQEKDVLDWVRVERIGLVARSVTEAALVTSAQMDLMRKRIREMQPNRAVFEVRDLILQAIHLAPGLVDETEAGDEALEQSVLDNALHADVGHEDISVRSKDGDESIPSEMDLGDLHIDVTSSLLPAHPKPFLANGSDDITHSEYKKTSMRTY